MERIFRQRKSSRTRVFQFKVWHKDTYKTVGCENSEWHFSELINYLKSKACIPSLGHFKVFCVDYNGCRRIPIQEAFEKRSEISETQTLPNNESRQILDVKKFPDILFEAFHKGMPTDFKIISPPEVRPRRQVEIVSSAEDSDSEVIFTDKVVQEKPTLNQSQHQTVNPNLDKPLAPVTPCQSVAARKKSKKLTIGTTRAHGPTQCYFCLTSEKSTETRFRCPECKFFFHTKCLKNREICLGNDCDLQDLLHFERKDGSIGCPEWFFDLPFQKRGEILEKITGFGINAPKNNFCLCCLRDFLLGDKISVDDIRLQAIDLPDSVKNEPFDKIKDWVLASFKNVGVGIFQFSKYDPKSKDWINLTEATTKFLQGGQKLSKSACKDSSSPYTVKFSPLNSEYLFDIEPDSQRHKPIKIANILSDGKTEQAPVLGRHTIRQFQNIMNLSLDKSRPYDSQIDVHQEILGALSVFKGALANDGELLKEWKMPIPGCSSEYAVCSSCNSKVPNHSEDSGWGSIMSMVKSPEVTSTTANEERLNNQPNQVIFSSAQSNHCQPSYSKGTCEPPRTKEEKVKGQLEVTALTSPDFIPILAEEFDHEGVKWWIVVSHKGRNMQRFWELFGATMKVKCPATLQQKRHFIRPMTFIRWNIQFILIKQTIGQTVITDQGNVHSVWNEVGSTAIGRNWLTRDFFEKKLRIPTCKCRIPQAAKNEISKIAFGSWGLLNDDTSIPEVNLRKLVQCVHGQRLLRIPQLKRRYDDEQEKVRIRTEVKAVIESLASSSDSNAVNLKDKRPRLEVPQQTSTDKNEMQVQQHTELQNLAVSNVEPGFLSQVPASSQIFETAKSVNIVNQIFNVPLNVFPQAQQFPFPSNAPVFSFDPRAFAPQDLLSCPPLMSFPSSLPQLPQALPAQNLSSVSYPEQPQTNPGHLPLSTLRPHSSVVAVIRTVQLTKKKIPGKLMKREISAICSYLTREFSLPAGTIIGVVSCRKFVTRFLSVDLLQAWQAFVLAQAFRLYVIIQTIKNSVSKVSSSTSDEHLAKICSSECSFFY